jgi:KTSC domain-containing protein
VILAENAPSVQNILNEGKKMFVFCVTAGVLMTRTIVNSSAIHSVGYDPPTEILEIEFQDGTIYQYAKVPETVHAELMSAESKGRYFEDNIKRGPYECRRVG